MVRFEEVILHLLKNGAQAVFHNLGRASVVVKSLIYICCVLSQMLDSSNLTQFDLTLTFPQVKFRNGCHHQILYPK